MFILIHQISMFILYLLPLTYQQHLMMTLSVYLTEDDATGFAFSDDGTVMFTLGRKDKKLMNFTFTGFDLLPHTLAVFQSEVQILILKV